MVRMTTEELRDKITEWRMTLLEVVNELFNYDFTYSTEEIHPEDAARFLRKFSVVEADIYKVNMEIRKVSSELIKIIKGEE